MRLLRWRKEDIASGILGCGAWGAVFFLATRGKKAIGNRIDGWMILGDRRGSARERRRTKIKILLYSTLLNQ